MENSLSFGPLLYVVGLSPGVHLLDDPIDQILLLARLDKNGLTLIIETSQNLLEFINSIMLDSMAQILGWI